MILGYIYRKIKNNKDIRRIGENFMSLSVLNLINYIFPLLLIPYLTRTLGPRNFGLYSFAYAILSYFTLFVRYGFEFSATKQIAIIRDKKEELNKLFSSVLGVRILLILFASIVLIIFTLLIPRLAEEKSLFYSGVGIYIGWALIPVWFFQGMENMKYLTVINFLVRLISTASIFIFVHSPNDYKLALFLQSVGFLVGGIGSVILVFVIFKIAIVIPTVHDLRFQLKEGWQLFLSTVGMTFYRESNVLILGFLTNYTYVGYYAAAEKIIKAFQSLIKPFTSALYPYFGRKFNTNSNSKSVKIFFRIGNYLGLVLFLVTIIVIFFSSYLIHIYLGDQYVTSILNIQVLGSVILIGGLNYYFGIVGLVNFGKSLLFTRSVWIAGIVSLGSCILLVSLYKDLGASIAMVIAEIVLLVQILMAFSKLKKQEYI